MALNFRARDITVVTTADESCAAADAAYMSILGSAEVGSKKSPSIVVLLVNIGLKLTSHGIAIVVRLTGPFTGLELKWRRLRRLFGVSRLRTTFDK